MNPTEYIVLGLIAATFVCPLVWRKASRRVFLPCPSGLAWLLELENPFTKATRAATIIEILDLQPGMKVLDVGCGPGRLAIPMARKVGPEGEVVAIDIQRKMLGRAEEKARAEKVGNIRFALVGTEEGKLNRNAYDRAALVTVLGEIPDPASVLRKIFLALKPGGILSVTEVIFDPHFLRRGTVLRLGEEAGFQEKEFFGRSLVYTLTFEKPV